MRQERRCAAGRGSGRDSPSGLTERRQPAVVGDEMGRGRRVGVGGGRGGGEGKGRGVRRAGYIGRFVTRRAGVGESGGLGPRPRGELGWQAACAGGSGSRGPRPRPRGAAGGLGRAIADGLRRDCFVSSSHPFFLANIFVSALNDASCVA